MRCSSAGTIRSAVVGDLDRIADLLAEAFADYPWTRWSIPTDGYSWRLRELQRLYLAYALRDGVVLVNHEVDGVIALLPPTAGLPAELQSRVAELFGERIDAVAEAELPPAPSGYWTLETVGVRPSCQGAGLGRRLVRAGLETVDASGGLGVALETSADENVRLYERCGFAVVATTQVKDGPVVHSMATDDLQRLPDGSVVH